MGYELQQLTGLALEARKKKARMYILLIRSRLTLSAIFHQINFLRAHHGPLLYKICTKRPKFRRLQSQKGQSTNFLQKRTLAINEDLHNGFTYFRAQGGAPVKISFRKLGSLSGTPWPNRIKIFCESQSKQWPGDLHRVTMEGFEGFQKYFQGSLGR